MLSTALRLLAIFMLLLGGSAARADQPQTLRWRFQKGQTLKYLLKHREVRTTTIQAQQFETTTNTEYEWQWAVQDVDDKGVATLELKLTGLRVTSQGKDFDFEYDSSRGNRSDDDYKKKLIHLYDQLRLTSYRMRLKPDGQVAEVTGLDKVLADATAGTQIADFHGLNLHDDSFAWYLQLALGGLPSNEVMQGAKWKGPLQTRLTGIGEASGPVELTLEKTTEVAGQSCRQLNVSGSPSIEVDMKWFNQPLRGTLKANKLAGKVYFNPKSARVQSSAVQFQLAGDLKFGGDKPVVMKVAFRHELAVETLP